MTMQERTNKNREEKGLCSGKCYFCGCNCKKQFCKMAKKNNTADIGFEDKIWKAADLLRGSIDAAEYKNVVLGLIFLKYISDCFDVKHQQLVDEGDGFEEDKDEYISENIFYVPADARWSVIAEAAHTPEIGKAIDNAMMEIEKENLN